MGGTGTEAAARATERQVAVRWEVELLAAGVAQKAVEATEGAEATGAVAAGAMAKEGCWAAGMAEARMAGREG